jgi:hypothetical protein
MGEQQLKNIARPVRVYRVVFTPRRSDAAYCSSACSQKAYRTP